MVFFCFQNSQSQQNEQIIVHRPVKQMKPIILKVPHIEYFGHGSQAEDCYMIWQTTEVGSSDANWNTLMMPYVQRQNWDLSTLQPYYYNHRGIYKAHFPPGTEKATIILEDAEHVSNTTPVYVLCGKINIPGITNNYEGFVIASDIDLNSNGWDKLVIYPELETVNSIEYVSAIQSERKYVFCGTKKEVKGKPKMGIIFGHTLPSFSSQWSYEYFYQGISHFDMRNTELNTIKKVANDNYVAVGTTNITQNNSDILIVSINPNKPQITQTNVFGTPYNTSTRIASFESGVSLIGQNSNLYVVGTIKEVKDPEGLNIINYYDLLLSAFTIKQQDVKYPIYIFNWATRYNFYTGSPYTEQPEDIIYQKKGLELAIVGSLEYSQKKHDGFIMDIPLNHNSTIVNVYGKSDSDDYLHSLTESYTNTLVASGISDGYSTNTVEDLWIVHKGNSPNPKCDEKTIVPETNKVVYKRSEINLKNNVLTTKNFSPLRQSSLSGKDSIICSSTNIDTCFCENIQMSTSNKIFSGDTCAYSIDIMFKCNSGDLANIKGIQFEELNGESFVVYPPNGWNSIAQSLNSFTSQNTPVDINVLNSFQFYFFDKTNPCRQIVVNYGDFSDPDIPTIICTDTTKEMCCPPCPEINDLRIKCDTIQNSQAVYEVCFDVDYIGNAQTFYVTYTYSGGIQTTWFNFTTSGNYCVKLYDNSPGIFPNGYIDMHTYLLDINGNPVCNQTNTIQIPDCCPEISDVKNTCLQMTADGQAYELNFTASNNWNSDLQLDFSTDCGPVTPSSIILPANVANFPITLTYINNPVCMQIYLESLIMLGNDVLCDQIEIVQLDTCDNTNDCNVFFEKDDSCCCYYIKEINPSGKELHQVNLNVYGGTAVSLNNLDGCSGIPTPLPATSVTWNYAPDCDPIFWNFICFQSDNASSEIISDWIFTYNDGSKCSISDTIKCKPLAVLSCDTISVYPIPDINEQEEILHFDIHNNKVPFSPICSVFVNYNPSTMITSGNAPTSGGFFVVDGGPTGTGDANRWKFPYTQLLVQGDPNYSGNDPIVNFGHSVGFNIGMNYFNGYNGILKFTIKHCDGQECEVEYPWTTTVPNDASTYYTMNVVKPCCLIDTMTFFDILLVPTEGKDPIDEVLWVTLTWKALIEGVENYMKLEAISGSFLNDGAELNSEFEITRQGKNSSTFKLTKPRIPSKEQPINLKLVFSGQKPDNINFQWTLYNQNVRVIERDSINKNISGIIYNGDWDSDTPIMQLGMAYPNPSAHSMTVEYYLSKSDLIDIDLLDLNGKIVKAINKMYSIEGKNTITFDTYEFNNGNYYMRFRSSNGNEVTKKVLFVK
jgi:hypothetical protein